MDNKKNKLSGLNINRRIGEIIDITMGDNNVMEVQVSNINRKYVKLIINAPDNWGNR